MAVTYDKLNDRDGVRRCLKYALDTWGEDRDPLNRYKIYILSWLANEPRTSLMDDASAVLGYDADLSMYILYGACAVADNTNVAQAYDALCSADEYYQGKSAMVKILRCICADLLGQDESWLLSEIYELEEKDSLTSTEELYLTRYLFVTNRYDELWGYIVDAGSDNGPSLDAELAAMKASWYFKNQTSTYFSTEAVGQLLDWVEMSLAGTANGSEERELLLLSRALLQSCVGEIDGLDIDPEGLAGVSDLEYALIAARAFNAGKYQEALQACEQFFNLSREDSFPSVNGTVFQTQMEPQEQVVLRYFVQLVSARSHFEYAKPLWKGSDDWTAHMEAAERECAAFQQSSKSLFYISEQFKILQNSIDIANGRIPPDSDGPIEVFPE